MEQSLFGNPVVSPNGTGSDFVDMLRRRGVQVFQSIPAGVQVAPGAFQETHGTTILGFKYKDGVLIAGDRRATAGNAIVYDRADKVLEIDRRSVMAIAGSPGAAWEMARVLEHSLQFFRRTQLQEMSVDAKVRALSKLIRENFGMVLQGVGVVVPLFATSEPGRPAKLFFYDAMGAQFEAVDYATSGSGSIVVRATLYFQNRWSGQPLKQLDQEQAIVLALRALEASAEADTATGGVDRRSGVFPVLKLITADGVQTVSEEEIGRIFREKVA